MTLTKSVTVLLASMLLGASLALTLNFIAQPTPARAGSFPMSPALSVATTSAAFSVTTSARVLATTTNPTDPANSYVRDFASICNPNANPVALLLNADKPANGPSGRVTVWIAAAAGYDACYEITDRNQYMGSVTASSTNQTATSITVIDYVHQ